MGRDRFVKWVRNKFAKAEGDKREIPCQK